MPWASVANMFAGIGKKARSGAVLALYGPFKYDGEYTSASNVEFDRYLKGMAPHQGIRDLDEIAELAEGIGFELAEDNPMPANNRLLVFRR